MEAFAKERNSGCRHGEEDDAGEGKDRDTAATDRSAFGGGCALRNHRQLRV